MSSTDHGGGKRWADIHFCLFLAAAGGAGRTSAQGSFFLRQIKLWQSNTAGSFEAAYVRHRRGGSRRTSPSCWSWCAKPD